jgi:hypothetical protein
MNLERFSLKFFARPGADINEAIFIDIFHEWIRLKRLSGILLDVVDYRHVPEGPGIMLISHDINFSVAYSGGRFKLSAQRKRGAGLTQQERILELIRASVEFGALLETDPRLNGRLRLEGGAFHYIANDRLLAPNTTATFLALQPDLSAVATRLYPGQRVSLTRQQNDPRERLTALVEAGASLDMAVLRERVGVMA